MLHWCNIWDEWVIGINLVVVRVQRRFCVVVKKRKSVKSVTFGLVISRQSSEKRKRS